MVTILGENKYAEPFGKLVSYEYSQQLSYQYRQNFHFPTLQQSFDPHVLWRLSTFAGPHIIFGGVNKILQNSFNHRNEVMFISKLVFTMKINDQQKCCL